LKVGFKFAIRFESRPASVVPLNFIGGFHVLPQLKYLGEFEANFLREIVITKSAFMVFQIKTPAI
jgi:hypothetical protein